MPKYGEEGGGGEIKTESTEQRQAQNQNTRQEKDLWNLTICEEILQ